MAEQFKACSVDGCNGNAHYSAKGSKGLCRPHYQRDSRYGDPLAGKTAPGDPIRFIDEIAVRYDGGDCLVWPYGKDGDGYGRVHIDRRQTRAHRYVCMLVHGAPPTTLHETAHSCNNRPCVNPNHLRWATTQENADDRGIHGTNPVGELHGKAKLSEAEVKEILRLKGVKTQRAIAAQFNISKSTVAAIHVGVRWSSVT